MIKYNLFIIALTSCLTISTQSFSQSDPEQTEGYSLLWEITGNGLENPSYLFGTMHVRDKRAFEFPDSVLIVLDKCEALATEVNFDSLFISLYAEKFEKQMLARFYGFDDSEEDEIAEKDKSSNKKKKGSKINLSRKDVSSARFRKLETLLNDGTEIELAEVFLDAYLFQRAKNLDKLLFGLEEIEDPYQEFEQTVPTENESTEEFEIQLLDSLSEAGLPDFEGLIDKRNETIEIMTSIYQNGDLTQMDEFIKLFYGEDSKDVWLLDRNKVMLESMKTIMPQHSLFAAVGCAHLPGKGGLLELLETEGFKVRRVIPNRTGVAESKMSETLIDKWELVVNEQSGFKVEVPSKPAEVDVLAGFKMYISSDIIKDKVFMFYGVPCALAGIDPTDSKSYKVVTDRLKETQKISAVHSEKRINFKGQKGCELLVSVNRNYQEFQGILRLFIVNRFMYVFISMPGLDEDSDRFFESINFLEPVTENSDNSALKIEPESGFSAVMPGRFEKNVIVLPQDPSAPDFKVKMSQFIAMDMSDNTVTAIFKSDLPPGQYLDNDSTAITAMLSEFDTNITYCDLNGEKIILENGISGFQPSTVVQDESMSVLLRAFIRGPSIYILYYQAPKLKFNINDGNEFFNSVEFLALIPDELSEKKIEEIHVLLANEPINDDSDEYDNNLELINYDYFPNMNISVSIYKEALSKYLEPEPIDSIYKNYTEDNLTWQEKIIRDTVLTNEMGDQYLDLLIGFENASTLERRIVYYKNDANYNLSFHISPELKNSIWLEELVKKIYIDDLQISLSPEERNQLFFDHLLSDDIDQHKDAWNIAYSKKLSEQDIEQINVVLNSEFEFEESNNTAWIHEVMLDKLAKMESTASINSIRNYFENSDNEEARTAAFKHLKVNKWTDLNLKDVIESNHKLDPNQQQYNILFLEEIKDSLAEFIENIPYYLTHFQLDNSGRNGLLYILSEKRDTLELNGFETENILGELNICMDNALDSITDYLKQDPTDFYSHWEHSNTLENIIILTEYVDNKEFQEKILQIPFIEYNLEPSAYLEYKIVQGLKVDRSEWEYMEKYNYGFYNLISRLIDINHIGAIPQKYLSSEKLTEIAFRTLMEDDWGEVNIGKSLGTKTIHIDDKDIEVMFFIFQDNYSPEEKYIGYSELVTEESIVQKSIWDLYYDYNYSNVEPNDYNQVMNQLINGY